MEFIPTDVWVIVFELVFKATNSYRQFLAARFNLLLTSRNFASMVRVVVECFINNNSLLGGIVITEYEYTRFAKIVLGGSFLNFSYDRKLLDYTYDTDETGCQFLSRMNRIFNVLFPKVKYVFPPVLVALFKSNYMMSKFCSCEVCSEGVTWVELAFTSIPTPRNIKIVPLNSYNSTHQIFFTLWSHTYSGKILYNPAKPSTKYVIYYNRLAIGNINGNINRLIDKAWSKI